MTTAEILVQFINSQLGIPIYFDHAPSVGAVYPCIAYKKVSSESDHTFDGPAYSKDTYEFVVLTVKGNNAGINMPLYGIEGARFWANALNTLLDGYDASMYSINTAYNEEYDDDTATYQVMQSYGLLLMTSASAYTGSWTGSSQYSDILRGNGATGNVAVWESPYVITETSTLTISGSDVIMVGDLTVHGAIHAVISASNESASYADKAHLADTAISASYALTASYVSGAIALPDGIVTSSAQIDYTDIRNKPTNIASASFALTASYALNSQSLPAGVLSSSAQVDYAYIQGTPTTIATASYVLNAVSASYAPLPTGLVSSSAQVLENTNVYSSSLQLPVGIVSSSAQVLTNSGVYSSSAQLPSGIVSGSQQIAGWSVTSASYSETASYVKFPDGIVSSSAQVLTGSNVYSSSAQLPLGLVSSSAQVDYTFIQNQPTTIATASYAITASYALNSSALPAGLFSSSAQVDYNLIQNQPTTIATASYVLSASRALTSSCVIRNSGPFDIPVTAIYIPYDRIYADSATLNSLTINNENESGYFNVMGDASIQNDLGIYNNLNVLYGTASIDTLVVTNPIHGTSSWSDKSVSASYAPLPQNPVFNTVGIGQTPTAYLHIKAGTTTAGTAPLKFTSGSLTTIPESGTIEFDGSNFWLTI